MSDYEEYFSDSEDEIGEIPEYILSEETYFKKLDIISKFKQDIGKECEFYGIKNIHNTLIYSLIYGDNINIKKHKVKLTDYQIELFNDLYDALGKQKQDYNNIYNYLYNIMY